MNKLIALMFTLCLIVTACGSGDVARGQDPGGVPTTAAPAEPPVVEPSLDEGPMLVLQESGGCFMAGPNCRTISFWADGSVNVAWPDEADRSDERSVIDASQAAAWLEIASGTNFDDLVARLPEGECQGCYDGIDTMLEITLDDTTVTLDSMTVEFVQSEPLFAATTGLTNAVPFTLGEAAISSDPTGWNTVIEPTLTVEGLAVNIEADLPVVDLPGRALGGGLLDTTVNVVGVDAAFVYLEIGRAAGCATFEHLALVPTAEPGDYELFYDTDNNCEAFGSTGYRTPRSDLTPAADGTITVMNGTGAVVRVTLE